MCRILIKKVKESLRKTGDLNLFLKNGLLVSLCYVLAGKLPN